ncbi:MAG: DUF402 domain-containing protein [Oscillospiraceae bacterium]|nr:DUF402 domain-containing protein [Oscillospiraceae bacterium]
MERRKYLGRAYKDYYKTFASKIIRINEEDVKGYVSLVKIEEVNRPLIVGEKGSEICLNDNGYKEISFLPDNENWKICAMYDDKGIIIEWYFDITRKNSIDENGDPYCDDMYLDAVLMPDGRILILDEDELRDALDNGNITQDEFDMACRVLNELIERKIISIDYMENLCSRLLALFEK